MPVSAIVGLVVGVVLLVVLFLLIRGWITIYNKFQYWINRAERKFADIDVVMQQRIDNILALAQMVKKYDIHEYKTLKDVIEARSRWTKDTSLNEKVRVASEVESNYLKLQAVFEKYPDLKADKLHLTLMSRDSHIESRLRQTRMKYNHAAQQYNQKISIFPRNIVARLHSFTKLDYLSFEGQEKYDPRGLFDDEP
jgi:LemA protein